MPTWSLALILAVLLLFLYNGITGMVIEWPAMRLPKKISYVLIGLVWLAITARVGFAVWQRLF